MKSKTLKFCFSVGFISLVFILCVSFVYIKHKNRKVESALLGIADNIIKEDMVKTISNSAIQNDYIQVNEESADNSIDDDMNQKNSIEEKFFSQNKIQENNNVFGKIVIEKIGVNAPIMDGVSSDVLKVAVGHFKETSYWENNVALASHNRGSYAHYFEKINQLDIGDEIKYQTELGTRIYVVQELKEVSEQDLSVLEGTNENTLTLITCIKNKPELRLCVKAVEKL